jgi:hypothetical protein
MYRAQTPCNLTRRTLGVKPPSAFLDDGTTLSLNPGKMKSQGKRKMIRNQFKNTHKGKQELSNESKLQTAISIFLIGSYCLTKLDCYDLLLHDVTGDYKIIGFRGFIVGPKA